MLLYPQKRTDVEWQEIKAAFENNLVINQMRGSSATGVSVVQGGGEGRIFKLPVPAIEFVKTAEFKKFLTEIDSQTTLLLGHTRQPTKGDPDKPQNNHPLEVGQIFGVHNGQIENDDALFSQFNYPRQAEVDSEIIFKLMEDLTPGHTTSYYLNEIRQQIQMLDGKYVILASDRRAPARLIVAKHQNPLSIHFQKKWNALVFSSSYLYLRKTFGRSVLFESLPREHLFLFDAYAIPIRGTRPIAAAIL